VSQHPALAWGDVHICRIATGWCLSVKLVQLMQGQALRAASAHRRAITLSWGSCTSDSALARWSSCATCAVHAAQVCFTRMLHEYQAHLILARAGTPGLDARVQIMAPIACVGVA
jgi:hypothetical protein